MNLKQFKIADSRGWRDRIADSDPAEQLAMTLLITGSADLDDHHLERKERDLYIDGSKVADLPDTLHESVRVILEELRKLKYEISDSLISDAFENIRKHFGTGTQFSLEQLKKSGYNKLDDGKQVGLQLYSPWAKEHIDKVVETLYSQFSKQHNYNTSPVATKGWIKEFVELGIKDNPEGAFRIGFGVIDNWLDNLKNLVTSQVFYESEDSSQDSHGRGNSQLD